LTVLKHSGIYVIRLAVTCAPQLNIILAIKSKEDKMGRACGTHWGEEKFIQLFFWWGNLKEMGLLEDLGVDGRLM